MTGSKNNTDEVLIRQEAIMDVRDRLTFDYLKRASYSNEYWEGFNDAYKIVIEYLNSVIDGGWQEYYRERYNDRQ